MLLVCRKSKRLDTGRANEEAGRMSTMWKICACFVVRLSLGGNGFAMGATVI